MGIARRFAHLCLCICIAAVSSADEYQGKRVAQVRFQPAQQPLPLDELQKIVRVNPRAPLSPADIRNTIKALYSTGRYADVAVDAEPAADGEINLVIRTVDQWFIGPVEVKGKIKAPPNEGQLANATRLDLGQPYED